MLGGQYLANDNGQRQQPFSVVGADAAPWAFAGTGLTNGSQFGTLRHRDRRDDAVLPARHAGAGARARPLRAGPLGRDDLLRDASGARVFSAGVLNFGGTLMLWPRVGPLLDNVWARLAPAELPAAMPDQAVLAGCSGAGFVVSAT